MDRLGRELGHSVAHPAAWPGRAGAVVSVAALAAARGEVATHMVSSSVSWVTGGGAAAEEQALIAGRSMAPRWRAREVRPSAEPSMRAEMWLPSGQQFPRLGPRAGMASTKVHFLVQGPLDPDEARGSFLVEGEDVRLADVAAAFPFEAPDGRFHFRFKWSPSGDERRFFWLDMTSPRERVPVREDGTVVTKVVLVCHRDAPWSYELAADAPAHAKRQVRDFEPDPLLLGSWEDLAPEAEKAPEATAGSHASVGVPGGTGVAAVLSETAGVVGKRFHAARDNLNFGHVSRSFGSFLSSAVKAASSYVGGGQPPSDAALRNLETYARALGTLYDAGSARHVNLLRRLWVACFPDADFQPQSPRWKSIGFQHTDPASDFRGGGLLSLRALVYVAEKHSAKVTIKRRRAPPPRSLTHSPLPGAVRPAAGRHGAGAGCADGVQLSGGHRQRQRHAGARRLARPARRRRAHSLPPLHPLYPPCTHARAAPQMRIVRRRFWPLFEDPHAFFHLFSIVFAFLDRLWTQSGARYMEFGHVMKEVKEKTAQLLETCPTSVDELAARAAEHDMLYL